MNFSSFISNRINQSDARSGFTSVMIRIGVIAVAVSIAVLLIAASLIAGFRNEITAKMFGFWGHIHVTSIQSGTSMDAIPFNKDQKFLKDISEIDVLPYMDEYANSKSTLGGVGSMYPFIHYPGLLSTKKDFEGVIMKGIDKDFDWKFLAKHLVEGDTLNLNSIDLTRGCIISKYFSNRLNLHVGDAAILNFMISDKPIKKRLLVEGVYDTGLAEYDRKFILGDMRILHNVLNWDANQVSGFSIQLDHLEDMRVINEHIYLDKLPNELYSESIRSKVPAIFDWLELLNVNEQVMFIIMLIVSSINIITVLLILILDRLQMIGVLKALGARNGQIRKIFLRLGVRIMLWGLIFGNILALTLVLLQKKFRFITLDQENYYLTHAPVHIDLPYWLMINLFVAVVTFLILLIPTLVVGRVDVIKVLRFD